MTFPESYGLVYDEAVRALESQERRLVELRTRAGTLVSALTIATSFLGAEIFSRNHVPVAAWIGLGCFIGSVVALVVVLIPRRDRWVFEARPSTLLAWVENAKPPLQVRQFHRELSVRLEKYFEDNQKKIDRLYQVFLAACLFLGVEVGFLTFALTQGR